MAPPQTKPWNDFQKTMRGKKMTPQELKAQYHGRKGEKMRDSPLALPDGLVVHPGAVSGASGWRGVVEGWLVGVWSFADNFLSRGRRRSLSSKRRGAKFSQKSRDVILRFWLTAKMSCAP
jgi:hypothetical protein